MMPPPAGHCEPYRVGGIKRPRAAQAGDRLTVEFTVTTEGRVKDVTVIASSNPEIDDDIVRMVRRWRFSWSSGCGDRSVPKTMRFEIKFD